MKNEQIPQGHQGQCCPHGQGKGGHGHGGGRGHGGGHGHGEHCGRHGHGAQGHPGGHPGGHPDDKNPLRLLFWELTSGCNLRCIHCRAVAQPERVEGELSTQECFSIIDNLVTFANPILVLTGGEPLYRPDFFDIAAYANSKGLRVAMATNGTLVTGEIAKKIKDVGIQRVSISLDGATAETHDAFRGIPGSFEAALRGFENLKKQGLSVQFNTTVAKHNLHEIKDILKLAVEKGADALHIFMLVPVGCGVEIADEQMVSAETYEELLHWFYEESKRVPIELKATCAPHYHRVMRQRAKEEGITLTFQSHGLAAVTKGCLAGSGVAFLSSKGKVQPCGYLPVTAGDIHEQSLKEIWEKSEAFLALREPDNLKGKCGVCEFRKVCEGCRARAFAQTGDYLGEEPYCAYKPRKYVQD